MPDSEMYVFVGGSYNHKRLRISGRPPTFKIAVPVDLSSFDYVEGGGVPMVNMREELYFLEAISSSTRQWFLYRHENMTHDDVMEGLILNYGR